MAEIAPPTGPEAQARAHDTLQFLLGAVEADALARRRRAGVGTALPIVVVAGFLGAGKTTLLRHLLTSPGGRRITALVNDMAALNIDASLIAAIHGDTLALGNGCACCTQSGGATRALLDLLDRPRRPDIVLLEASGIADPWALAHIVGSLPGARLDHVVTLVDAGTVTDDLVSPYLQARQLSAADLILPNKIDLLGPDDIARVSNRLRALAPRAEIIRTTHARVPPWLILDGADAPNPRNEAEAPPIEPDIGFDQRLFHADGPLDRACLDAALAALPAGILRAKGFLRLGEAGDIHLLQLVGRRWTWEAAREPANLGRLVVIGLADAFEDGAPARILAGTGLHEIPA